jgi:hypothetical protein
MPNEENIKDQGFHTNPERINRKGRPIGSLNTKTRLKYLLEVIQKKKNPLTNEDEEMSVAEQLDLSLVLKALKGDVQAYREVFDRYEGKVVQKSELFGLNGGAIEVKDKYDLSKLSKDDLIKLRELQDKMAKNDL